MEQSEHLPPDVLIGASLRGNEYGWAISDFSNALTNAEAHGYACLGGQFQFRLPDGRVCEMYWLDADSLDRRNGESWDEYSHRSCREVLERFRKRVAETNFAKEAASWHLSENVISSLVFVAYFVTEDDLAELSTQKKI